MKPNDTNIYPVFERIAGRPEKEILLGQKAISIWLIGLSGAGKTTIGSALEKQLIENGVLTQILDGDNIRSGINRNLKFTETDREENIRRIAEVNKLFINCGVVTINCFINPTHETRNFVEHILGKQDIITVFINTPIEICEQRDVKGLYKKARAGELKNFTGIDSPFEAPENPDVTVFTEKSNVEESARHIFNYVIEKIKPTWKKKS